MASTQLNSNTRDSINNVTRELDKLVDTVRANINQSQEPKAQALFETTAEVLLGLRKAYKDYGEGNEEAWQ